ncbi:Transcriptional activator protein UGA3 [Sphaceloma murrayae]|uniref:Transcriptional activator protein UGA3 n=1 Tax=Sphaceloma murrayae TaxID=2082308 RepID=A0A2K1QRG7_9PEZI|nr:Transcriptional activator protein UGA3 [Sphaceloma murrayae]
MRPSRLVAPGESSRAASSRPADSAALDGAAPPQSALSRPQQVGDSRDSRDSKDARDPKGKKRSHITIACNACRSRKHKCSGDRPVCTACQDRGSQCVYDADEDTTRLGNLKRKHTLLEEETVQLRRLVDFIRDQPHPEVLRVIEGLRSGLTVGEVMRPSDIQDGTPRSSRERNVDGTASPSAPSDLESWLAAESTQHRPQIRQALSPQPVAASRDRRMDIHNLILDGFEARPFSQQDRLAADVTGTYSQSGPSAGRSGLAEHSRIEQDRYAQHRNPETRSQERSSTSGHSYHSADSRTGLGGPEQQSRMQIEGGAGGGLDGRKEMSGVDQEKSRGAGRGGGNVDRSPA